MPRRSAHSAPTRRSGCRSLVDAPWYSFFPWPAIALLVLSLNFVGDGGVRDLTNTREQESALDDLDRLRRQVEALFRHDAAGRLTTKNKPILAPAPRLFLGRCLDGNLWRYRDDLPDELLATLEPLLSREPKVTDLAARSSVQFEIVAALAAHAPIVEVIAGPAWTIPSHIEPSDRAVLVTPDASACLRPHFQHLIPHLSELSPCAAILENYVAVSVCFSARITSDVCEAGLDTIPAARGNGHGPSAVATWAAAIAASDRQPLYSTSWENSASRRVADKLGLTMYAVDLSIY